MVLVLLLREGEVVVVWILILLEGEGEVELWRWALDLWVSWMGRELVWVVMIGLRIWLRLLAGTLTAL